MKKDSPIKKAIYPGTFDPITFGHCDIIARASRLFEELLVAIAIDTNKSTLFSVEKRAELVEAEIKSMKLSNVRAVVFKGLLVDFASFQRCSVIIRGLRAVSDFEQEFQMAYMNHKMSSDIETVMFPATDKGHFISSTFVKAIGKLNGDLTEFVSTNVIKALKEVYE